MKRAKNLLIVKIFASGIPDAGGLWAVWAHDEAADRPPVGWRIVGRSSAGLLVLLLPGVAVLPLEGLADEALPNGLRRGLDALG